MSNLKTSAAASLLKTLKEVIVGQDELLEGLLTGLLTDKHILIEGLPGLAKTLSVSTLAKAVSLDFKRIQFTPDLLPTDVVGTMIFNSSTQEFTPKKGPIFTNILLADEINRAPAKVQSALLEAMEEKQVTIGEKSYPLPDPFLVLATQNPIEQEGTYPLPEAQKDRFLFKLKVPYPSESEELEILNRSLNLDKRVVSACMTKADINELKKHINSIHLDEKVKKYIIEIVIATRQPKERGLPELDGLIEVGASPRATVNLPLAARVQAYLNQRDFVSVDDVKRVAYPLLRHRIILSYEAQADQRTPDELIQMLLKGIEVPQH